MMQKQRILSLLGLCSIVLALLAACGSQGSGTVVRTTPTQEQIYVLDSPTQRTGSSADPHIIAFHPGNAANSLTLPAGLFSQDHQRIYSATPLGKQTAITITNAQTGTILHEQAHLIAPRTSPMTDIGLLYAHRIRREER